MSISNSMILSSIYSIVESPVAINIDEINERLNKLSSELENKSDVKNVEKILSYYDETKTHSGFQREIEKTFFHISGVVSKEDSSLWDLYAEEYQSNLNEDINVTNGEKLSDSTVDDSEISKKETKTNTGATNADHDNVKKGATASRNDTFCYGNCHQGGVSTYHTVNAGAAKETQTTASGCHTACHGACHSACHGSRGWR